MRIAIDTTCVWNRRGFGRFTVELLRALVARHPEHDYVLLVDREPARGELPEACAIVNASPERTVNRSAVAKGRRSLADMLRFTRAARRTKPDVLFFPAVYSFFPVAPGTRTVVCFHDTIAEDHPELVFPDRAGRWAWKAKMRLALWQATRVMTISEASRRSLATLYGLSEERIDLVTEGPSPSFLAPSSPEAVRATLERLGLPGDRPLLLHVGGMSPHKNLTTLLEAAAILLRRHAAYLVLVGDPEADGFHANAAELRARIASDERLRDNVRFTGFVSDADLVHLYRGALALVFPSLAEGFGLPAVEAMACGLPVLASRAGSLPEVVGDAGLLFDPRDARGMAESIERILVDDGLRRELSRRARERVRLFTWERAADLALASFRRAIG